MIKPIVIKHLTSPLPQIIEYLTDHGGSCCRIADTIFSIIWKAIDGKYMSQKLYLRSSLPMYILQRWPKGATVVAHSVKYPRNLVPGIMWRHRARRSRLSSSMAKEMLNDGIFSYLQCSRMTRWLPLTLYHHRHEYRETENRTVVTRGRKVGETGR